MKAVWTSCVLLVFLFVFLLAAADFTDATTVNTPASSVSPKKIPPRFFNYDRMKRKFLAWPSSHSFRLKCKATGSPPITFRWLKNGRPLLRRRLDPHLNTSLWYLKLKDLIPDDDGNYTCIIKNPYGSISHTYTLKVIDFASVTTSVPTTLQTKVPPRFVDYERMKRKFLAWPSSHSFRLKCKATGSPPITFRWLKNGRPLLRLLDPHLNTSLWYLKLKDLIPDDDGNYTCVVKNPYGSISHTYTLKVIAKARSKPRLQVDHPKNTTATIGQNASMKCIVVASGTLPDFRWLKWKKLPKGYPDDIKIKTGSYEIVDPTYYVAIDAGRNYGVELVIVNVTEDDFGLYTCYVGNHIGVDHRSAFLLRKVWPTVTDARSTYVSPSTIVNSLTLPSKTQVESKVDVKLLMVALAILSTIIAASAIGLASLFCYSKWVRQKARHNENRQLQNRQQLLGIANLQRLTETKNCKNNDYLIY